MQIPSTFILACFYHFDATFPPYNYVRGAAQGDPTTPVNAPSPTQTIHHARVAGEGGEATPFAGGDAVASAVAGAGGRPLCSNMVEL